MVGLTRRRNAIPAALLGAGLIGLAPIQAQTPCTEDAMVVFDGSGSMSEMGYNLMDEPRIFDARRAVRAALPGIADLRRIGLVIYGPGPEASACDNVDLRFGPRPEADGPIIAAVDALRPDGETPLTRAVALAAEVLGERDAPGIIVLITDGMETCGGAPCELADALVAEGRDLTIHVIGFRVRGTHFSYRGTGHEDYENGTTISRCLADRTGGTYRSTETAEALAAAIEDTLGCQVIGGLNTPWRWRQG